jgi:osmotically-inducible protein OsmY
MSSLRKMVFGLASTVALSTAAFSAPGPTPDEVVTRHVQELFAAHTDLGPLLYVQTIHGTVYITGTVSSGLVKENAESLAKTVSGVKGIVDTAGISK